MWDSEGSSKKGRGDSSIPTKDREERELRERRISTIAEVRCIFYFVRVSIANSASGGKWGLQEESTEGATSRSWRVGWE